LGGFFWVGFLMPTLFLKELPSGKGKILCILSLSFLERNVIFFDDITSLTDESPELLLTPILQKLAGNVAGNIFRPEQSFNQSSLATIDRLPAAVSSPSDIQQ
jgi:hypothetical protein